ncbi:DUF3850 domain-containing protein [Carnobacterium maltaromaticum]|uniref:DUF3850 domain-containing protein n=1 Tax=Carnobacterium maltaromaticum TaxID=2751 RepID=UPI003C2350E0
MKVHELKIASEFFEAVKDGRKKFEIRKNDRNYQEGDILILREYDPITQEYLGRIMKVEISYMTDYAQQDGYVVLGIEEIWEDEELTEIKKVVIPKFVAEFLGSHWEDGEPAKEDKADLIRHQEQYIRSFGTSELKNWIVKADNFILFVEAVMNGYEVEKEKLYYVKLPITVWNNHLEELETTPSYLHFDNTSDEFRIFTSAKIYTTNFKAKLTEERIKSIDERYWAFAVEAEGEE